MTKEIVFATINSQSNSSAIYQNRDDLLLVKFPQSTVVAGVFTQSKTRAFCVDWSKQNIKNNPKALIVNAGNANACTGENGKNSTYQICHEVAKNLECTKEEVLMCSTGVIGVNLPYEKIKQKIPDLVANLSDNNFSQSAKAILTTDNKEKIVQEIIKTEDINFEIKAFAKGSGMIAPNMATMLGFIFTDINIEQEVMQEILTEVNEKTFNSITVDSDCSTNDTVLLFSTNKVRNQKIINKDEILAKLFKESLMKVMVSLAKQIIADAEGATKIIEVQVCSTNSYEDAKKIAKSVAQSPLVKTAIAGCDANWGRIMMAIGKSEVELNQENISISIGGFAVVKNGILSDDYNEKNLTKYLTKENEIKIKIDLQNDLYYKKSYKSTVWGCDLTKKYIEINADYRS